jgi:sugar O-acyltransferase (sialic acid O-acetyltransferase NeuD family)
MESATINIPRLAIIGAGGLAKELALATFRTYQAAIIEEDQILFLLDEDYWNKDTPEDIMGVKILKMKENLTRLIEEGYKFIIGIGDPNKREFYSKLLLSHSDSLEFGALCYHNSPLGPGCTAGIGTFIAQNTSITVDIKIGNHTVINQNCSIGHDATIGDFTTVSPGVMISGHAKIGNYCNIGTGAQIRDKVSICDNVTIGMGATVLKDITQPGVYVGTPAKRIK